MSRNPSTFIRRGSYVYRLAQEPIIKEGPEGETDEEYWERFYEKHVEELPKAYTDFTKIADKLLQKAKLSGDLLKEGLVQTKDGVDLIYNIESRKIPGAKLRFDFSVGWLQSLETFLTKKFNKGNYTLNEVVFEYCDHAFVANQKNTISDLLRSLMHMQKTFEDRPRKDLGKLSKDEADKFDYTMGLVQDLITKRGYDPNVLKRRENVLTALKEDAEALRITDAVLTAIQPIIEKIPQNEWEERIQKFSDEMEARRYVPSRQLVEEKVQELTAHEQYNGRIAIDYSPDGRLVVGINAPYTFIYIFSREPGGRLTFVEAGMEFCQKTHIAHNEEDAKRLITANLDLAQAYETAANVENEGNKEPAESFEELVTIFHDLHREEMVKFLQAKFPKLDAQDIERILKQIATRGFEKRIRETRTQETEQAAK